jgi:hypothetical protein
MTNTHSTPGTVATYIGLGTTYVSAISTDVTLTAAQVRMPYAGTLSNFEGRLNAAVTNPSGAGTFTVYKNGSPTAVTCGGASFTVGSFACTDLTNTVTFAAGDLIAVLYATTVNNSCCKVPRWTAQYTSS